MEKALEQVVEWRAASGCQATLDAAGRLRQNVACKQVCLQSPAARKVYLPQFREKVVAASTDCPRQRLQSGYENLPWTMDDDERPDHTKAESMAPGYLTVLGERFEMLLWICEGSHHSVCTVH